MNAMIHRAGGLAAILGATLLAAGCANNAYLESKRYTAAGGQMERDTSNANAQFASAQVANAQLQTTVARQDAEIAENARRIKTLNAELQTQHARLTAALKSKRLTQARHDQLKRELDGIRADSQSVELENDRARMAKTQDPKAEEAKRQKLKDLETRKKQLETQLGALRTN
ncbi:MAG: hypothetical protein WA159_15010 [Variovorax sp.]